MSHDERHVPSLANPPLSNMADVRQSVFASLQSHIEAFTARGGDLIPLHIGDTHLAPPDGVVASGASDDLSMYGPPAGLDSLRDGLAVFRRERGLVCARDMSHVHVGCGCTHALFCAIRAALNPGDAAIVVSPFWPLITGMMHAAGVTPIQVSRPSGDDFRAVLAAALTPNVRALYFVSPNNPDGHVMTASQLETVARFAQEHDLWVFADEVYADFVYDGEHSSIANLPGMAERTVTSHSLSKSHGLAGARIGYIVAPQRLIDTARRVSNHTLYNVPVAMQRVALSAVEHGDTWLADALSTYRTARDATARALETIGVSGTVPAGGSFFFLNLADHLGDRSLQFLLERAIEQGVLLAPGAAFGDGFASWLRLCFTGVPLGRTLEGVRRLGTALAANP
jgi:aspartate/methionine/tyrosine aminotransferase